MGDPNDGVQALYQWQQYLIYRTIRISREDYAPPKGGYMYWNARWDPHAVRA